MSADIFYKISKIISKKAQMTYQAMKVSKINQLRMLILADSIHPIKQFNIVER